MLITALNRKVTSFITKNEISSILFDSFDSSRSDKKKEKEDL